MITQEQYNNMVNKANLAARAYYTGEVVGEEMSDNEYDKLLSKIKDIEIQYGYSKEDSPTTYVGYSIDSSEHEHTRTKTIKHNKKVLSLLKVPKEEIISKLHKINEEYGDVEYTLEPKYDGMHVVILFGNNGIPNRILTRGDGESGQDITQILSNIIGIENIHHPSLKNTAVSGELILSLEEYNNLCMNPENNFSNPRNAIAGIIHRNIINKNINLTFKLHYSPVYKELVDVHNVFKDTLYYKYTNINDLYNKLDSVLENRTINIGNNSFSIDGWVIKVNNPEIMETLGNTTKYPKWAFAVKPSAMMSTTELVDLEMVVSRFGTLTPVGVLNPVELLGTMVSKATLNNLTHMCKLGLMEITLPCKVVITKGGDIIPTIVKVIPNKDNGEGNSNSILEKINRSTCSDCGAKLIIIDKPKEGFGGKIACPNEECLGRAISKLTHFCSIKGFNIKQLSSNRLRDFYIDGGIRTFSDIFNKFLDIEYTNSVAIKGIGKNIIFNIISELTKSIDSVSLARGLSSISIPLLGLNKAISICGFLDDIDRTKKLATLIEFIEAAEVSDEGVVSIGNDKFKDTELAKFFTSNKMLLKSIRNNIGILQELNKLSQTYGLFKDKEQSSLLKNKIICITGGHPKYTREDLIELIYKHGGSYTSNIKKATDLLASTDASNTTKYNFAKTNNINILDIDDIIK